jgi:hypothetical protein
MGAFYRFVSPFRVEHGMVICVYENQWVSAWALKPTEADCSDDPPMYHGVAEGQGRYDWGKEEEHCSDFLAGMVYWQAVSGGLPHISGWQPIKSALTDPLRSRLPLVWEQGDTQLFSRRGWVLGLMGVLADTVSLATAWRSEQDVADLSELGGVDWLRQECGEE